MLSQLEANDRLVQRILRAYDVPFSRILPPQKGYRNASYPVLLDDGTMRNLILYKREPGIVARIRAANAVSDYLAGRGFPARQTMSPHIIKLTAGRYEKYGALYNYLDGHTIPWEAYGQDHLKLLGKTMSDMHAALKDCPYRELPDVTAEYLAIVARMRAYFALAPVQRAMADKLLLRVDPAVFDELTQLLIGAAMLPAKQPLHMDFVRSNILFGEADAGEFTIAVTGILDFEKAAYGHPLFDIARTLAFLLVDCKYKQPDRIRKYFLGGGYIKRGDGALPSRYIGLLNPLVELFLFYDFYKFLRHNPYESLSANEHFVRTVGLLIPRHLVVPTTSVAV